MSSASDLLLETEDHGGTAAVTVHGALETATADEFRRRLRQVIEAGPGRVELDLADVWFLDGAGIGVLVGAARAQADQGGELVLSATSATVRSALHVAGLDRLIAGSG